MNRKKKRLLEAEEAVVEAIARRDRFQAEVTEEEKSMARLQEEHQSGAMEISAPSVCSRDGTVADKNHCKHRTKRFCLRPHGKQSVQRRRRGCSREDFVCTIVRRRCCPVDARPSSRHARRNVSREHALVSTVVPNCGCVWCVVCGVCGVGEGLRTPTSILVIVGVLFFFFRRER